MTEKLTRLELTWPGKEDRFNPEPRILLEDKEKSFSYEKDTDGMAKDIFDHFDVKSKVQPTYDNMLIHGDNLLALKALEQDYTGKVKCIYIDPPYNTGSAFLYYDDGLEHSIWLSLMRDRLEILKNLLSPDGAICVQIDATEMAHLKVLLDEIFARHNFINIICCKTKIAGVSGSNLGKSLQDNIEFILLYAKDISNFMLNVVPTKSQELMDYITNYSAQGKSWKYTSVLKNIDSGTFLKEFTAGNGDIIKLYKHDSYEICSVNQIAKEEFHNDLQMAYYSYIDKIFRTTNAQTSIRTKVIEETKEYGKGIYSIEYAPIKGKNAGKVIRSYYKDDNLIAWLKDVVQKKNNEIFKLDNMGNLWDDIQYNNLTKEGNVQFPNGKKPEALISRIIDMLSMPGDLVLDSFLGSGTTAAVAHKMGRRWIGIEMGDQAYTHCLPRLQNVITGNDSGGISTAVNWLCGGGFKFYELASSLIVKDKYGQQIISDKYNADMLAEAMCKILGYHYKPDAEKYWKQGFSSEKSFIFTTTMSVQEESLDKLAAEVGDNNLLICCSAFVGNKSAFPNITVKKIPSAILKKCEWGREGYPLNLSKYTPKDEDFEFEEEESEE
ncbi:MAG: site-specific DNA-methyltransferase [Alphaproteobacteria bacterium]|nr:site-specific DNA-methyltransferase [Alphaproteobacteria bacterium]